LAEQLLEDAVKVGERLEPDFERDFTHAQIRVEEEVFRFFDAHAGDVIGEIDTGDLLEHFAEIEGAHIDRLGDLMQRKLLGLVVVDVFAGALDDRRLGILLLNEDLIAQYGQVLGKNGQ
jgi:hypothetical protein